MSPPSLPGTPAPGSSRFTALVTVLALGAAGVGAYLRADRDSSAEASAAVADAAEAEPARALPLPDRIDAIVVGGGPTPDANQVSLEDDVRLAGETFGSAHAVLLFAGGPGTRSVQVADLGDRGDPLLGELGDLLAPRAGRDARYRPTTLALHGAGTLAQLESILELAMGRPGDALTVYVAGHGESGASPAESRTLFWGGDALDAVALAEWLDAREPRRAVRFVVTSCFAGGLGEIAFEAADRTRGASAQDRCGLFATSWDEEASGCDPDPVRAHHDGFGVHFLAALRGEDRDGQDHRAEIDLDHDGAVSPSEALTFARIASRSIDVPTTTSEIYLRAVAPAERASVEAGGQPLAPAATGPGASAGDTVLPEQDAVITALLSAMGLADRDELVARLDETRARKGEHDAAMEEALATLDERYFALSSEMLSRWPVLDDPFHPDFAPTLAAERGEIARYLESSPNVRSYAEADEEVSAMSSTDLSLRLELSLLRRLDQAFETRELAARLRARGGAEWERYLAFRQCEGAP